MENNDNKKMSYEQLENIAHQLSEQNRKMYMQLQEYQKDMMIRRLEFLFKVLEFKDLFDGDYIEEVLGEIKDALTIKDEEQAE